MNKHLQDTKWAENVILVDADYADKVAFNLITNFERMLERRIPSADFTQWMECVAIDGGMQPLNLGEGKGDTQQTQVILTHGKGKMRMDYFVPADFETELNGKAFNGRMGEFLIGCYPVEVIADGERLLTEILSIVVAREEVKRVMVIANTEDADIYNKVREALKLADSKRQVVTVFSMDPSGASLGRKANFGVEILGYSLMAALGIRGEEISERLGARG